MVPAEPAAVPGVVITRKSPAGRDGFQTNWGCVQRSRRVIPTAAMMRKFFLTGVPALAAAPLAEAQGLCRLTYPNPQAGSNGNTPAFSFPGAGDYLTNSV